MFNSTIFGAFRLVDGQKITGIKVEGVDSSRSNRISVSGYDEHTVPFNGQLYGAHSA